MHDPHAHHHHGHHHPPAETAPAEPGYPEHPEQPHRGQGQEHLPTRQREEQRDSHGAHAGHEAHGGAHDKHAGHSVAMFRDKFWLSLLLTIPTLIWGHMLPRVFGYTPPQVPGAGLIAPIFGTVVYLYGGWPFLKGFVEEIRVLRPGMMTLVALAITVAYVYSAAVVFGLPGMLFFWETATLIDLMLLGHWIEMRSVMGASRALEELARLLPGEAHLVQEDGSVHDIPVQHLRPGHRIRSGMAAGLGADRSQVHLQDDPEHHRVHAGREPA